MRVLYDTSILVAALVDAHPRHRTAWPFLRRAHAKEVDLQVATHSLAESYAVLTRLPIQPRILPETAADLIRRGVVEVANLVSLDAEDYRQVVHDMAEIGLSGGVVYDGLIARVAQKVEVDLLVTFNPRDFRRVWPDGAERILDPSEE